MVIANLEMVTLLLIFLVNIMVGIYCIALLIIFLRRVKLLLNPTHRNYYIIILIHLLIKLACTVFLGIYTFLGMIKNGTEMQPNIIEIIFKNVLAVADLAMIELFLSAALHYLVACSQAISNTPSKCIVQIAQFLSCLLIVGILITWNFCQIPYQLLNFTCTVLNALIVVLFLVGFFYLNFKLTGIMFDTSIGSKVKALYKLLAILLLSRVIVTILEILIGVGIADGNFQSFIQIVVESQGQYPVFAACFVAYIVEVLLTEGLPIMYSLRSSIVEGFSVESDQSPLTDSIISSSTSALNDLLIEKDNNELDSDDELQISNFTDITHYCASPIFELKKALFGNTNFILRMVSNQVSNYIVEDLKTELSRQHSSQIKVLNKTTLFFQNKLLYLVEPYRPYNLDSLLSQGQNEREIIRIAIKIAKAIQQLHTKGIAHGCLKPSHILFDQGGNIYINGLGMHSLKKYLSLITGYSNKSIYCAVQQLAQKNNVILKPKYPSDIYSFGMMLYEMLTGNRAYREQELKDIRRKFSQQGFRPKIPVTLNEGAKGLIRKCWQQQQEKRPNIETVIALINKL